jgi:hypothetical protein
MVDVGGVDRGRPMEMGVKAKLQGIQLLENDEGSWQIMEIHRLDRVVLVDCSVMEHHIEGRHIL